MDISNFKNTHSDYADPLQLMSRFYQQVVEIKRWLDNDSLDDKVKEQLKLERMPNSEEMAEATSLRLQRYLEKARKEARKLLTELEFSRVEEAIYVMAALADEIFIMELDWPGKDHWEEVLLEQKLFSSSYSGEKVINASLELINTRTLDLQQQQLVAVYLLALRLGFEGRLRGDSARLPALRQKLFKRISVSSEHQGSHRVCAEAYQHLLASWQERRLAPLAGWYRVMALGGIGYIVAGFLIWSITTASWT